MDGGASTTSPDDPCLQGLTVPPSEVIARINQAKGQGGRLDLAGIGLRRVPDEVWTLTKLTDLQLSNNRISSLPDAIGNLTSLERLGLAGNPPRVSPRRHRRLREPRGSLGARQPPRHPPGHHRPVRAPSQPHARG